MMIARDFNLKATA
jgi:hypothetical protein